MTQEQIDERKKKNGIVITDDLLYLKENTWDLAVIQSLGTADNVADLMVDRIHQLPEGEKGTLTFSGFSKVDAPILLPGSTT